MSIGTKFSTIPSKEAYAMRSPEAADMFQMKKFAMIPGSLKRAFSEKSANKNLVVQVFDYMK